MSDAASASRAATPPDLLGQLVARERDLAAVERYARAHDRAPAARGRWRDLIPLDAPGPGEQYAFDVDLDACTGCKACVTACHGLNGLDPGETWRAVGVLGGGTAAAPYQQHVTTACHHCVDPACLAGCPVNAYAKDPITGIVRHLDDQCIGCQYCTLTCPYDVPQFDTRRGIVRKCDMCRGRLAAGEPPACVQACPNEAITITKVRTDDVVADNEVGAFLPGAPDPGITQPTTIYRTARAVPRNAQPVDWHTVRAERAHPPLTVMLVLTQLAVGAFAVAAIAPVSAPPLDGLGRAHALVALAIALVALGASALHLGRPLYAFRAVLGFRRSWLSREVLAFGAFAGLAGLYAVTALRGAPPPGLAAAVAATGAIGVGCSVMVYAATGRDGWRVDVVAIPFALGTAMLGLATTAAALWIGAAIRPDLGPAARALAADLAHAWVAVTLAKLAYEATLLVHVRDRRHTGLRRRAEVMLRPARHVTVWRFVTGGLGGAVAPAWIAVVATTFDPVVVAVVGVLAWLGCVAGELLERHLFFVAAAAPRMPGGAP